MGKAMMVVVVFSAVAVGLAWATLRNVAPDAVTKATTYNPYEGDISVLTDGKYPGNDPNPASFRWLSKGILAVELPKPMELKEFRVYVGEEAGGYKVRAYLGGKLNSNGLGRSPEGELKAEVEDASYATDTWMALKFPPRTVADNLEFWTFGAAEFYEVQILAAYEEAVEGSTWGNVKAAFR
ncbi:MAG TPA: hypothetical protein EYP17_09925 [Candidatus Latescibacteria bacterium]|nr:hypothetical protein [Candidatus Latescibacterota bacterium]